ncbi:MAG: Eco57I restriction-modification methylase domain-containing protein [Planctomycetes bacterium]|nr:Eco57I restriction-modification methylase domain-containing protein [Planctomycetota bacterium]
MISKLLRASEKSTAELLDLSSEFQGQYEARTSLDERKKRGQFFTPPPVARFMAGLLSKFPQRIKVLDPGAGIGILSAAVCERTLRLRSPRHVELVLYETDQAVIRLLDENMTRCRSVLKSAGHTLTYEIHAKDFILSNRHAFQQPTLFDVRPQLTEFDAVIMNPPYFKIRKNSAYARIMERTVHGQPNIYALFMALAAEMLRPGGELVAITPRSFCSGVYFRGFRRWFLGRMSLRHIHLFESRKDMFRSAKVLQESVITSTARTTKPLNTITVTTTFGADMLQEPHSRQTATTKVIDDSSGNMVIRIPENAQDARIMDVIESWPKRFADHGLCVSTGPVVLFRSTAFLLDNPNARNAAPLLTMRNVQRFETVWPLQANGKPAAFKVCTESLNRRLLLPTRNYVLLRRFSAKEERRRLTASCFLKANEPGPYVALENHLNYIYHAERELTNNETYGLAGIFNSALLDRYFRTLSGNTQVNATELRAMNFPDLETISRIGRRINTLRDFAASKVEHIILDELGVNGILERYLMEFAR